MRIEACVGDFGNAAVKVMVFCSRAQWMGLLSDVLPLSHKYSEQALFVWADPKTQSDAADAFGLSASSTFPALALHSTADDSDDKFRLQDNGGGEVTAQSMYIMSVTKYNANVTTMFLFLYRIMQVFKDYFGDVTEESIRDNFVIIYELLDEMMDHGYALTTEPNTLKLMIDR